jgi:ABC-type lipoprotein release transport system permease subunit
MMTATDIFRISIRMLQTNILRSLLTVLGIGVAISFIVILIGLGYGVQSITIGSIVESKSLLSLDVQPSDAVGAVPITPDTVKSFEAMPGVADLSPVVTSDGEVVVSGKRASVVVNAVRPEYLEMEGVSLLQGRLFEAAKPEIVISKQALDLIGLDERSLGETIALSYTETDTTGQSTQIDGLTIVGIAEASVPPTVYFPVAAYAEHLGEGKTVIYDGAKVVGESRNAVVQLRSDIVSKGYVVDSLIDTLDQATMIFRWVTIGLGVFGMIALVVAAIGMFNTLTIALLERTHDIGIMKAIGVSDKSVKELFLAEAMLIGLSGGIVGVALGTLTARFIEIGLNVLASYYNANSIHLFRYPVGFLVAMIIFPILLAVLTGLYPSNRAAKLNPLQALRYE